MRVLLVEGWIFDEPCPYRGMYVEKFEHDGISHKIHPRSYPHGPCGFTRDISKAMIFADFSAAFDFWRKENSIVRSRVDGKANRPLTAMHTSIIDPENRSDKIKLH